MIFRKNILLVCRDAPAAVRFARLHARYVGTVAGNLKSRSLTGKALTTWEKRTPPSKDNIWRREQIYCGEGMDGMLWFFITTNMEMVIR